MTGSSYGHPEDGSKLSSEAEDRHRSIGSITDPPLLEVDEDND